MSDYLWPHGLQHTRFLWPSLSLTVCSNSCPSIVTPCKYLILCCPLLFLPSVFPSIRVCSNELALHFRWPKYWSFSISPSNEYSGLIFFRIDWFDLLVVQGILKSLPSPQFKSINSLALVFYLTSGSYLTLTSIHDYWKNHSFDYTELCWQNDISAF